MTNQSTPSRPFSPDISDRNRIINEGVEQLRTAHKQRVESHRLECVARAEREYLRAEQRRRDAFVTKWLEDNYVRKSYPYGDLSPAGQYRVFLESNKRLDGLAAVREFGELLYCLMARNTSNNKATIDQMKGWLTPFLSEVNGDYKIVSERGSHDRTQAVIELPSANYVVHAAHLSRELSKILTDTSMISVAFGTVAWLEKDFEISDY
jgi:hypothetical protein